MTKLPLSIIILICILSAHFAVSFRQNVVLADGDEEDDDELLQPLDDIGMYGVLIPVDRGDLALEPPNRDTVAGALDKRSWMRSVKMNGALSSRKPFIGQKKRKLSAGEWVSILQGIAQNKGILLKGKLKGVRFGISRK